MNYHPQTNGPDREEEQRRRIRPRLLVLVFLSAILITVAFFGWADLYRNYLEVFAPDVELTEVPRGIGLAPVSVIFNVRDSQSGLAEVTMWVRQKESRRRILKRAFKGSQSETISVEFPGERSDLEEGAVELEIHAKDRSLWHNTSKKTLSLPVDFHKPKIELFADEYTIRRGGSRLAFYRAFDESLAVSGIKAGNLLFNGFPARALDKDFQDKSLFVVLFAVPLLGPEEFTARLFAEDLVGNALSVALPCKILPHTGRPMQIPLSDTFLRTQLSTIADENMMKMQSIAAQSGREFQFTYRKGSEERLLEKFKLVNDLLREVNSNEIVSLIHGRDYERFWQGKFSHPIGKVEAAFGDDVTYVFNGTEVAKTKQLGFTVIPRRETREVSAMNDGVVAFSNNIGVYGRTIGIAHGLGLVSIYGQLYSATAKRGEMVKNGQPVGDLGATGLAQEPSVYVEMRLSGVPVDPQEWWDAKWYGANISRQISETKKALGIPVYRTLD